MNLTAAIKKPSLLKLLEIETCLRHHPSLHLPSSVASWENLHAHWYWKLPLLTRSFVDKTSPGCDCLLALSGLSSFVTCRAMTGISFAHWPIAISHLPSELIHLSSFFSFVLLNFAILYLFPIYIFRFLVSSKPLAPTNSALLSSRKYGSQKRPVTRYPVMRLGA